MTTFLKQYFSGVLVGIIASTWVSTKAFADSIESQPLLIFRILNPAQVPDEVLAQAKEHVQHIYRDSGIQIEWLEGDEAQQPFYGRKSLNLTIVLVSESVARTMGQENKATGFAIGTDGRGARRAYVFAERVERHAMSVHHQRSMEQKGAEGLILGHVIAHEAGHLMLPHDSHSSLWGIMRAQMGMGSIDQAIRGSLLFSPEQSKLMRSTLLTRSGL